MQNNHSEKNNSKGKKSTIGETFATQKEAERFLQSRLPSKWPWREQTPDFFIDFHIEVVEHGQLSGFEFAVQIKGTKRAKHSPSIRMDCKHLVYYRDKARLPVFVVLVDLISRNAYWLFAQRYLRECANKTVVDTQTTFTVTFDCANSFNDLERFRKALKDAEHYMRELYPGTPAAAISAKEAELQQLDPDIGVKVSFDDGEILHLFPKKPLHYTFRSLNSDGFKSFHAMLDHGDDFEADVDVTPPDSPLFGKLTAANKGHIKFEPDRLNGCVQIIVPSTHDTIHIDGKWRRGRKSVRFEGGGEDSPLRVELRIHDWLNDDNRTTSFNTPISLAGWEGQPFLRLAAFDDVRALVSALAHRRELLVKYFVLGAEIGRSTVVAGDEQSTSKAAVRLNDNIDWLATVRRIALHYGVEPVLPKWKDITHAVRNVVEVLDALAQGKTREERIAGQRFPFSASNDVTFLNNEPSPPGTVKLTGLAIFHLFGAEITVPNIEESYLNVRVVRTNTVSATAKMFEIVGEDEAVLIRRKIAA
jgi:Domain of unknown function (DUF4365)